MVFMLALLALVIDGGNLFGHRRSIVNATDAAALAAAQRLAQGGTCGSGAVTSAADQAAVANEAGATRILFQCPWNGRAGTVKVGYRATVSGLFSGSRNVSTSAIAVWGGAGSANVAPVEVTLSSFAFCNFPGFPTQPPPTPARCTIDFPKAGNGHWGGLDLSNWNVPSTFNTNGCHSSAQASTGWIQHPSGPYTLNYPNPTYVCADNGETHSVWDTFNSLIGTTFFFPVTDPAHQIPVAPASPGLYDVIGFVPLKMLGESKQGSTEFLTVEWDGPQEVPGIPGGGGSFGLNSITLIG
jgi:hypothetical protein